MTKHSTPVADLLAVPLRFTDGDRVRGPYGASWWRGLRTPGVWEEFPTAEKLTVRSDEQMRALLEAGGDWLLIPFLPPVTAPLPGTECTAVEQIRSLQLAPASGAALYIARLGRPQSFLGDDHGTFRDAGLPVRLRPADVRTTLEGVLKRHPGAKVTFHRVAGRAYARYATSSTLHTHIHLLVR
ncbi:hypothetical protein ACWC6I_24210 [Streptomyces sp. NPDC001414]